MFHTEEALLTVTAVHYGFGRHMLMLQPERIIPFIKVSIHYRLSRMLLRISHLPLDGEGSEMWLFSILPCLQRTLDLTLFAD